MSSDLGGLGSYALAVQTAQISMTKTQMQAAQAIAEMLTEETQRMAAVSETVGKNVDKLV